MAHSLVPITITVFIFTLAVSMTIPPHPLLITKVLTNDDLSSGSQLFGLFMSIYSFLQFFSLPILGRLSDKLQSRRKILLIQCSASCISFGLLAIVAYLGTTREEYLTRMNWLMIYIMYLFSRLMNGVLGNIRMISFTYVGDLANGDKSSAFGLIGVSIGMAFAIGPSITGICSGYFDAIRFPFITAFILQVLCMLFVTRYVSDSLQKSHTVPMNDDTFSVLSIINQANPFRNFSLLFLTNDKLRKLSMTVFLYGLGNSGFFSVFINYARVRYQFTSFETGIFLTGTSFGYSICQGILMKPIVKLFTERNAALLALFISSIGNFGLGFAYTDWMVFMCIPFSSFASMSQPLVMSLACKQVDETNQGSIQGALSSLTTLSAVISPIVLTYLFSQFTLDESLEFGLQGLPFLYCGIVCFISFIILCVTPTHDHRVLTVQHQHNEEA
jgi:DHA1 family tetracycline resistance protein-like MFS transporter